MSVPSITDTRSTPAEVTVTVAGQAVTEVNKVDEIAFGGLWLVEYVDGTSTLVFGDDIELTITGGTR